VIGWGGVGEFCFFGCIVSGSGVLVFFVLCLVMLVSVWLLLYGVGQFFCFFLVLAV